MPSLISIIDLVHPTVSGSSVITTDTAWVLFDREMDETTIGAGCFFLTGPDFDTWVGPDLQIFNEAESDGSGADDILESPGFEGIVQGAITFSRVSLTTTATVTGVYDVVGSGHLYRTKATFTPTNRFQADTTYTVHITGDEDESDTLQTGLSERTVFDTITSGTNTGTGAPVVGSGLVNFTGGYVGSFADTFRVRITTAGDVGDAKFQFSRDSDPNTLFGPFRTRKNGVLLSDCVNVEFLEGAYQVNDQWSVVVEPRVVYTDNIAYPFETGSGSITALPTTTSTTVLGDIPAPASITASTSTSTFSISSVTPLNNATNINIPAGPYTLNAVFSSAINAATVTSGVSAVVTSQAVEGEGYPEAVVADVSVSGSTLSIVCASGHLANNRLIDVTVDETVTGANGTSLSADYNWSFTTTYNPMYCTLRQMRLKIGAFIPNVPDDTINFAIYLASKMAEDLTWNQSFTDDEYYQFVRQQWACCKAEEILLMNTIGGSGSLKSKQLGDLRVEYNTSSDNIPALDRAIQCQMRWEGALMAGGRQVQTPGGVVKGQNDPDRPPVGRGYVHTRGASHRSTPVANTKTRYSGMRRYYNRYAKGWWS